MADAALVVVDSVAGVEVQTAKVWNYAEEYGLPRFIVVNRMDRENASFDRALESIQNSFGRTAVPLAIPIGEAKDFRGLVNLVTEKGMTWGEDTSAPPEMTDIPDELKETAASWREKLVEIVAESNEALMEEFFDKGTLPQEDLVKGLREAVAAGQVFPVIPASAGRNTGVSVILDTIVDLAPSPADRPAAGPNRSR